MDNTSKQHVQELMYEYIVNEWDNAYESFFEFILGETENRWCVKHYIYILLCDDKEKPAIDRHLMDVICEVLEGHSIEHHIGDIRTLLMGITNEHYLTRIKNIFDTYDKVITVRDSKMTKEETKAQLDTILQNTDDLWVELGDSVYELIIKYRKKFWG